MKYYVVADVHGFFSELKKVLTEKGFFADTQPHKLLICGDFFDRGQDALLMQDFLLDLLARDEVILVRGNHEDLALDLLNKWSQKSYLQRHHNHNGTVNTVCQLTGFSGLDIDTDPDKVGRTFLHTPLIQTIIPATVDYFETDHYIFVHGWIPSIPVALDNGSIGYVYNPNWRDADKAQWQRARWINGMEAAHGGVIEDDKTILCGHWHCSFGHAVYRNDGSEFGSDANFAPYYDEGIIALDACTAHSGKVNCIVIED